MNVHLKRMCKETAVACFKELSMNLLDRLHAKVLVEIAVLLARI
jgi:hypothetical protein